MTASTMPHAPVKPPAFVAWKQGRNFGPWHLYRQHTVTLCGVEIGRNACWSASAGLLLADLCKKCLEAYAREAP